MNSLTDAQVLSAIDRGLRRVWARFPPDLVMRDASDTASRSDPETSAGAAASEPDREAAPRE